MSSAIINSVTVSDTFCQPPHRAGIISTVNRRTLINITLLLVISWSFMVGAAEVCQTKSLFVYQSSGTMHCEPNSGIDLSTMGQRLIAVGIEVISMRLGFDGREGVAICGSPTGEINIYEIPASKINSALKIGFKRLSIKLEQ